MAATNLRSTRRTRISSSNQGELGREGKCFARAGDGDDAIFNRLAQDFQNAGVKLRDLV
jgi:hypothetical protein